MHDTLQKEIATYEKRTPKSAAAHKRALERIPQVAISFCSVSCI